MLLVTDSSSNVGVRVDPSGEIGVAIGHAGKPTMGIDLIDAGAKLGKGDAVVTSGLQQSVFPPGLPLGIVVSASLRPGSLEQTVTMRPHVDLKRVTFVKVLQWSPPQ